MKNYFLKKKTPAILPEFSTKRNKLFRNPLIFTLVIQVKIVPQAKVLTLLKKTPTMSYLRRVIRHSILIKTL